MQSLVPRPLLYFKDEGSAFYGLRFFLVDLGIRVQSFGFRIQGLGFGLGFRV